MFHIRFNILSSNQIQLKYNINTCSDGIYTKAKVWTRFDKYITWIAFDLPTMQVTSFD